mgnify:CR=1 FL=1
MLNDVLTFWFDELKPAQWWQKDNLLDETIKDKFAELHQQASQCELYQWRKSAKGRLAEIIVLDQFSRNIYRDSVKAFSQDSLALSLAQEAINVGADKELNTTERSFLYMPFMHSESLMIHERACLLFKENGNKNNYEFEIKHYDIIKRFGRYPHRNETLNRTSSAEELAFLKQPNSSF